MRRIGDRKDGKLLRELDAMHFIVPNIYPNRCDNEAFISETIDLTKTRAYLRAKNAEDPDDSYSLFQIVVAALLKVITLRPKINRFIANRNFYQKNEVSASFVVKAEFDDDGAEALAVVRAEASDTLTEIRRKVNKQITDCRTTGTDPSTDVAAVLTKLPRFISKTFIRFMCFCDRHGWIPQSFIETDPYYASVVISNLGSVRLHAGYHHLTNWGTNSFFVVMGEKKKRPFYRKDGTYEMRESIDLGLTVDERIADGYYFSKSVSLLRKLIENPELLELPLSEAVKY